MKWRRNVDTLDLVTILGIVCLAALIAFALPDLAVWWGGG
jgi:hypothetical protein